MWKLATQGNQFSEDWSIAGATWWKIRCACVCICVCVCVCVRILLLYACNCCKTWPAFEEIERERDREASGYWTRARAIGAQRNRSWTKRFAENLQKTRVGLFIVQHWKMEGNWTQNLVHWVHTKIVLHKVYKQIITKIKSKHKVKSKTQSNTYETQLKSHLIAALSARHSQEYILYIYNTLYVCIYV